MNSMQVKDKIRNIVKHKNIDFNIVLRLFMYDRFIERLALSKYRDNFILKGGFYLSSLFGIENRMTMDIDAAITKTVFDESNIRHILEEIIKIDINDNVTMKIINISPIRTEDEYGGYRATINVKFESIVETFQIDIATGDPITPKAIIYKYKPIIGDDYLSLWAYNIETVLAEKLETVLSRGEACSRTRDYYDIYLIYKMYWSKINKEHLRSAIQNTFNKRSFHGDILSITKTIRESEVLLKHWNQYSKKNKYAENISFEDILECLEKIINVIEPIMI